jgi:Calx-beta domain-containing protein
MKTHRFTQTAKFLLLVLFLSITGAILERPDSAAGAATGFVVTNTNDSGPGSLRQALLDANANAGADVITFSIGSGTQRITILSLLPAINEAVTIDGTTQPGFAGTPLIELTPEPNLLGDGLVITGGNSIVRGLVLNRFRGHAIRLETGGGNIIEGNYIGTDAAGAVSAFNYLNGVFISGSSGNVIGGNTAAARNVISGNLGNGISIASGGTGNTIKGNYIGVNAAGTAALPNETGLAVGTANNTIGGSTVSARNVISGNRQDGVNISADGNVIEGNFIGTNAAGDAGLSNVLSNIRVGGSNNTRIGGLTSTPGAPPGNVVGGIFVVGGTGTLVQGNLIGTNAAGTAAITNSGIGISMWGDVIVGGSAPGARNIISGFTSGSGYGVQTANSGGGSIIGNYIGTDITGTIAIPNKVGISNGTNTPDTKIGGTNVAERNIISGNGTGIQLDVRSAIVKGNYIGTDVTGTNALPNTSTGIAITGSAGGNVIGGTEAGAANIIAFNSSLGINIFALNSFSQNNNSIRGNSIHSNGFLGIDLNSDSVTINDAGDGDTGPNNLQNFPVVTSVSTGATTTIQGSLNSKANSSYTLDFYSNSACDASGHGEGATFLGSAALATDANGNANFNVNLPVQVPAGQVITSTATDATGNTSEFSVCFEIGAAGRVQFTSRFYSVDEPTPTATINVTRTLGTAGVASVDYATSNGTATAGADYTAVSGTLTFAVGETTKSFSVPIINDTLDETPIESVNLTLSNPTGGIVLGTDSTSVLNIADNDLPPSITFSDASAIEGDTGNTPMTFQLKLSGPSGQSLSVRFSTGSSTALGGTDYQTVFNQTIAFTPGEISKTVVVPVIGDLLVEGNEVFTVSLHNASNVTISRNFGFGTIVDDDSLLLMADTNNRGIALDSPTFVRDPFAVTNPHNFAVDGSARIMLYALGAKLTAGEDATAFTAQAIDTQGNTYPLAVEFAGKVPSQEWLTQVVVKLAPELQNLGDIEVLIKVHGLTSNKVVIKIQP